MMSDEKKLTDEQLNKVSGGADFFENLNAPVTEGTPLQGRECSDYTKEKSWSINGNNENTGR